MSHIESVGISGTAPYWTPNAASSGSTGTSLVLPAQRWTTAGGSAALVSTNHGARIPNWVMDAAAAEQLSIVLLGDEFAGWTTFDVDVLWFNTAAGAGDVVWALEGAIASLNDSTAAGTLVSLGSVTDTAGANQVMMRATVAAGLTAPTSEQLISFRFKRDAALAGDTLANDASFVALLLTPA